jgi:hypothetical protein
MHVRQTTDNNNNESQTSWGRIEMKPLRPTTNIPTKEIEEETENANNR